MHVPPCAQTLYIRSATGNGDGPLLFLTFINDLLEYTSSDVRLFADDALMYRHLRSKEDSATLQMDLSSLARWECERQMEFHLQKCTVIHVTNRRNIINHQFTLHGHTLEAVGSSKYLGVTIINDLKLDGNIGNVRSKPSKSLGFLQRNLKGSKQYVKATAYTTMVGPTLEYASRVFDPYHYSHIKSLESVQRRAAKFATGKLYDRTPAV